MRRPRRLSLSPASTPNLHPPTCPVGRVALLCLQVLGLTEGYHGDTLGAMDAVSPSPFNGRRQTPWYSGRGLFLEPPTVAVQAGRWRVALPADVAAAAASADGGRSSLEPELEFDGQDGLFAVQQRMAGRLYSQYRSAILSQLQQYNEASSGAAPGSSSQQLQEQGRGQQERHLGALIIEPVLQGAGGMRLIDPLYQRALVEVCRQAAGDRAGCGGGAPTRHCPQACGQPGQPAVLVRSLHRAPPGRLALLTTQGCPCRQAHEPSIPCSAQPCPPCPPAHRERRIPVIYDEVFTGFWRLGATSGAQLLGASPDVACYAKLLTGGLVPLSATLATDAVFKAFEGGWQWRMPLEAGAEHEGGSRCACWLDKAMCRQRRQVYVSGPGCMPLPSTPGQRSQLRPSPGQPWCAGDSKMHALLHGHSYTAHPIGCAAGVAALQLFGDPQLNPNLCTPQQPGRCRKQARSGGGTSSAGACNCTSPCGSLLPLWDNTAVAALSAHPAVRGVVPLGTVLAVQLRADDSGGYASNAAAAVVRRLRSMGIYGRPLGDIVYVMVSPMTERAQCDALLAKLAAALDS